MTEDSSSGENILYQNKPKPKTPVKVLTPILTAINRSNSRNYAQIVASKVVPMEVETDNEEKHRSLHIQNANMQDDENNTVKRFQYIGRKYITTKKWFKYTTLLIIIINCVFIAVQDPTAGPNNQINKMVKDSEIVFSILFTIEMFIKMFCNGLFGIHMNNDSESTLDLETYDDDINPRYYRGYFKNNWNLLDFIIVISSWIEWIPINTSYESNLTAIRLLRILRPLRAFTKIKKLKVLISTIILSLRGLRDVMFLLLFLFVIFGIFGVQLFNGLLHRKCFDNNGIESEFHCDINNNKCPSQYPLCLDIASNPNGGITNFDNFLYSIINIFVIISLEGWVSIMYILQDSGAAPILTWVFFLLLTFIVGFFAANLFLAVIESVYTREMNAKHENDKHESSKKEKYRLKAIRDTEKNWVQTRERNVTLGPLKRPSENNTDGISYSLADMVSTGIKAHMENSKNGIGIRHVDQKRLSHKNKKSKRKQQVTEFGVGIKSFMYRYRHGVTPISAALNINNNNGLQPVDVSQIFQKNPIQHKLKVITTDSLRIKHKRNRIKYSEKFIPELPTPILQRYDSIEDPTDLKSSLDRITKHTKRQSMVTYSNADKAHTKETSLGFIDEMVLASDFIDQENYELIEKLKEREKLRRQENEIISRIAIYFANEIPEWEKWINQHADKIYIRYINALVISNKFTSFITCIIILNSIILALRWPDMDPMVLDIFEVFNLIFTIIFVIEAILKIIGYGPKGYFMDNWNRFDFSIVAISLIEMSVTDPLENGGGAITAIRFLRTLRLLRTFRILGIFNNIRQLFLLVLRSIPDVIVLTILLIIFMFMFSALGMSLFGGRLTSFTDKSGRWKFDNFYWSMITVFMVISGDSWNEVMYDTILATNNQLSCLYYIILTIFGTFIILNLFIAILLSRMASDESTNEFILNDLINYSSDMFESHIKIESQVDRLLIRSEMKQHLKQLKLLKRKWKQHRDKLEIQGISLAIFNKNNGFRIFCHKIVESQIFEIIIDILIILNCILLACENPNTEESDFWWRLCDIIFAIIFIFEFLIKIIALGMFKRNYIFEKRKWKKIKDDATLLEWTDKAYQAIFFMNNLNKDILDLPGLVIECKKSNDNYTIIQFFGPQILRILFYQSDFATCYKLMDREEGKWEIWHPNIEETLIDTDIISILKSYDLTNNHHNAYFASNWNRMDSFVVFVAILSVIYDKISYLRALRAFRPFRIMIRFNNIKLVLQALLRSIPKLFNASLFIILFWFVLSTLGCTYFSGLYSHCIDTINENNTENIMYTMNKTDCMNTPGLEWYTLPFNFDNVFESLHSLFVIATLSGWNFIMYYGIDSANEINEHLIKNNKPLVALYFMLIVILCSYFSLNLIVSVVVDNFNKIKAEKDGSAFQTQEQVTWINNKRLLDTKCTLEPSVHAPDGNKLKYYSFKIVEHYLFDPFIMLCIIINSITMSMESYNQSSTFTITLYIFDIIFVTIFIIEVILKICGYGFTLYILNNWNKFDFIISISGLFGIIGDVGMGLSVLRIVRIARILRIINKAHTLKMLFWTLISSIPSLFNIGSLIFVTFFVYAIFGMHILNEYEHSLQNEVNFNTFGSSIAVLYRVGTEDGWTDVYSSYIDAYSKHNQAYKVYIYFISFFIFGTLIIINLFIAVVLDSFQSNSHIFHMQGKFDTMIICKDIWSYFDPKATRQVSVDDFIDILKLSPKPIGFNDKNPFELLQESLNIKRLHSLSGDTLARKLQSILDENERKRKLKQLCPDINHKEMLQLLISLKLIVYKKGSKWDKSYHTFWKKLLLSLGITSSSSENHAPIISIYDDDATFNELWYVSFDDAMISICSETIGPKLPHNYEIFEIKNDNLQITIAEWYAIKYECIHIYKKIQLDMDKETLYSVNDENENDKLDQIEMKKRKFKQATDSPIATRPLPQLIIKV